jgi:hypothetical protein
LLGETKFGLDSLMPTATCLPRVSSDFHSGSGVGSAAGFSAGVAVGVGVACWARGGAGSSFSPQADRASASAPTVVASARRRI